MMRPAEPTRRFVVLYHTGVESPHYDLMFEIDDHSPLITFRLPTWPIDGDVDVTRLKDHRRVYLDFEGEIPNTGRVDRVAEGQVHVETMPNGWRLLQVEGSFAYNIERLLEEPGRYRITLPRPTP